MWVYVGTSYLLASFFSSRGAKSQTHLGVCTLAISFASGVLFFCLFLLLLPPHFRSFLGWSMEDVLPLVGLFLFGLQGGLAVIFWA
jgi:ABC-type uncharacterized transport system permease subunit